MYAHAATIAPRSGASQKSQSWLHARPPTSTAGPKERAGFTEVPVTGINTICIKIRVRPITRPASGPVPHLSEVDHRTTRTKIIVAISSATNAAIIL